MSTDLEVDATATRAALLTTLETIGRFALAGNLQPDIAARVRVIVEELFLNTIDHGYGGECPRPVRLRLGGGCPCVLIYEDEAPPFDPGAWLAKDNRPAAVARLSEGEAGIAMLFGLSSSVTWEALPVGNRLVVTFAAR
jgi:anti-sigma regulatory factor (Ser/Thr protein kinase)